MATRRYTPAPAPAGVRVTVTGRPVFACGRWFQPGVTCLPPGYLNARQVDELRAINRIEVLITP
jgi:hypothetical protein